MENQILELEPKTVWKNFSRLNAVPRPSKKEEKVIQFMVDFGKGLGLETFTDDVGNVIIRKPATIGMENRKMITLQSHLDMVHQKNVETDFDFEHAGIQMYVDGDWVKANGTTLGADNGMGVAAIMSLLESKEIAHPPLEALFTIDEETGMTGAFGLKGGLLQGEILLNLDTEEDDEIDIGCAGGIDVTATKTYGQTPVIPGEVGLRISIKGLTGGHSGMDIHKGLGNANKIMNRLLFHGNAFDFRISSIQGGGLRNAIPRESTCHLNVDENQLNSFLETLEKEAQTIKGELARLDPKLGIVIEVLDRPFDQLMGLEAQELLLKTIYGLQNGVYRMSTNMANLVETSNNVAKVTVADGTIEIGCLTRSSIESGKMDLANALKSVFELGGFSVTFTGSYPGWNPNMDSEILKVVISVYTKLFDSKPHVVACHAGLECGILGQNYPEMDMVSFGPTIKGAHSPDERVSIPSVQKFWKFLLEILQHTP
ncbi:aminoacyl-histidine dipeptidase [Maribacter algicola]|uniref:Cytosol non-specific dipeptidase n=1 Tax=Maribacter algicola TaxID=2498892 RepID=A0A3R8S052_9FLAO|nr:aminoacyl-histidine dipeptidase [Maribacter algicola]RRQ49059.1 aminoacyl-histidine dipeptidase [Maribacter algicola]